LALPEQLHHFDFVSTSIAIGAWEFIMLRETHERRLAHIIGVIACFFLQIVIKMESLKLGAGFQVLAEKCRFSAYLTSAIKGC
jgi:hypothetical protein